MRLRFRPLAIFFKSDIKTVFRTAQEYNAHLAKSKRLAKRFIVNNNILNKITLNENMLHDIIWIGTSFVATAPPKMFKPLNKHGYKRRSLSHQQQQAFDI
jgi:hypothetical protein